MKRNFTSPWNPATPVDVSPLDYERQVVNWLREAGSPLSKLTVAHLERVSGIGGEYSLDGLAEFEFFAGAKLKVLIECKRHRRPIERDVVLTVHAKAQAVGAQKSMIFSTSGFQKGAIEFASSVGISLVIFIDGKATYETRSSTPTLESCYPTDLPKFSGQLVSSEQTKILVSNISDEYLSPLTSMISAT